MITKNKNVILKIEVPEKIYKTWKDVKDPLRNYFKTNKNLADHWLNYLKTNLQDSYKKQLNKGETDESLYKKILNSWDNMDPSRIMVIEKDISPEYISVYKEKI